MKNRKRILIVIGGILVMILILFCLWWKGLFLPSWINWKETEVTEDFDQDGKPETLTLQKKRLILKRDGKTLYETPERWKIVSISIGDIDQDNVKEILALAWRHGDYGAYRPNWVKHDTIQWREHLYIFEVKDNQIKAQWMSSKLNPQIKSLRLNKDGSFTCVSPENQKSVWQWHGYGVYRIK